MAASVTDWAAEPCSHSCQTRQDILVGPNEAMKCPPVVGSVYLPGPPVSCRYCVVGYLCPAVEWHVIFPE